MHECRRPHRRVAMRQTLEQNLHKQTLLTATVPSCWKRHKRLCSFALLDNHTSHPETAVGDNDALCLLPCCNTRARCACKIFLPSPLLLRARRKTDYLPASSLTMSAAFAVPSCPESVMKKRGDILKRDDFNLNKERPFQVPYSVY